MNGWEWDERREQKNIWLFREPRMKENVDYLVSICLENKECLFQISIILFIYRPGKEIHQKAKLVNIFMIKIREPVLKKGWYEIHFGLGQKWIGKDRYGTK